MLGVPARLPRSLCRARLRVPPHGRGPPEPSGATGGRSGCAGGRPRCQTKADEGGQDGAGVGAGQGRTPPTAKKQSPAELAQPLLEAIVEADDMDWWRIALFGTPHAAGRVKVALAAEFPEGWEWKSARDEEGRPAVFVRRVEA